MVRCNSKRRSHSGGFALTDRRFRGPADFSIVRPVAGQPET